MTKDLIKIEAKLRSETGKNVCRKIRTRGFVPGNILDKARSTAIELDAKLLSKAWQADKTFALSLEGVVRTVRIQELQINPVKRTALHVDLMYV